MNQPKAWTQYVDYDGNEVISQLTVFDPLPVDTGLLDANGNKIVRGPPQIGFLARHPREGS